MIIMMVLVTIVLSPSHGHGHGCLRLGVTAATVTVTVPASRLGTVTVDSEYHAPDSDSVPVTRTVTRSHVVAGVAACSTRPCGYRDNLKP
jgi:hypothetical protein